MRIFWRGLLLVGCPGRWYTGGGTPTNDLAVKRSLPGWWWRKGPRTKKLIRKAPEIRAAGKIQS